MQRLQGYFKLLGRLAALLRSNMKPIHTRIMYAALILGAIALGLSCSRYAQEQAEVACSTNEAAERLGCQNSRVLASGGLLSSGHVCICNVNSVDVMYSVWR